MRHATRKRDVFLVACCFSLVATKVSALEFAEQEEHPVSAVLIAEHASVQPGGATRIGVLFDIAEGWHIYAQDPGDAGLPTTVTWSGSERLSFGPLQWPKAHEFLDPGDIRTYGHTGEVVLFSTLQAPAHFGAGLRIMADVRWLACKDVCIPGRADIDLVLPLSPDPPVPSTHAHFFTSPSEL